MSSTFTDSPKTFYIPDAPKEAPEVKEINVDVKISIKGEHIMAELGCETYICHNLTQLVGLIRQALMDEMPTLKGFGKDKKESTKKKSKMFNTQGKEEKRLIKETSTKLGYGPIKQQTSDTKKT